MNKLNTLLQRMDSSIQLVRNQIAVSTHAPFLPDLYQQLGELLLQKANALYFLRAEKAGQSVAKASAAAEGSATSPDRQVLGIQQEAVAVFNRILEGFPDYLRRPNTLFLLASTLRALDDIPRFIEAVNRMLRDYPSSVETFRVRLLMGQHLFERKIFDDALKYLQPVLSSTFVFEKNLARYRSALIHFEIEKHRESLSLLEEIVNDLSLDQVTPDAGNRNLLDGRGFENLKREALLESTRVYVLVHANHPKPVEYYLKLAPSEELFQETLEKLANRYVSLKQFPQAVFLLRVLSERLQDPERILNTYRQALLSILPQDRFQIPAVEMERVLKVLRKWVLYYQVRDTLRKEAESFFESQIRDLGTRHHEAGKTEPRADRKSHFIASAVQFYLLYIQFFKETPYSARVLTNLADAYFNQKDFFRSGETYLQAYEAERAQTKRATAKTEELLKNAIYCFQQKGRESFYEQLRGRALLLRSIENIFRDNPRLAGDSKLKFVYLKTKFEQGFYGEAIPRLFQFAQQHRHSPLAADASELILDYYNTLNDLKGLSAAADRLLAMNFADAKLRNRIQGIKTSANFKRLEKNIQGSLGYIDAAESKQYLQAALSSQDATLMDAALNEALSLSKAERDIETFFKSAHALVAKEKSAERKGELLHSIAAENLRLTRFVGADRILAGLQSAKAYPERIRIALLMRDLKAFSALSESAQWESLDPELRRRGHRLAVDALVAGAPPAASLLRKVLQDTTEPAQLQLLYRSRGLLPPVLRADLLASVRKNSEGAGGSVALSRWKKLEEAEARLAAFIASLSVAPLVPESIEPKGAEFVQVDQLYRNLEGSGDPYLDSLVMIKSYFLYSKFASFLFQIGKKNPDLEEPLRQKAGESLETAKKFQQSCQNIVAAGALPQRFAGACFRTENTSIEAYLTIPIRSFKSASSKDPMNKKILELQKKLFADEEKAITLLALSREYLNLGEVSHAAAAASLGLSLNLEASDEFKVVLGCSLVEMGYIGEAGFHLGQSSSADPLKARCLSEAVYR